jgi:hypothetical protein
MLQYGERTRQGDTLGKMLSALAIQPPVLRISPNGLETHIFLRGRRHNGKVGRRSCHGTTTTRDRVLLLPDVPQYQPVVAAHGL